MSDNIIIILLISTLIVLIIFSILSYKNYKLEEKREIVPQIVNHFHIVGGSASAVVDKSSRTVDSQEDNSNKSEVHNVSGELSNNMNMTPHSAELGESTPNGIDVEEFDYEEDENLHAQQAEE